MKKYIEPILNISIFDISDVVTCSGEVTAEDMAYNTAKTTLESQNITMISEKLKFTY